MKLVGQFTMFALAGLAAAVGHYGTLFALVEAAGTGPVPASLAGFIVGGLISYALNYRFTFKSRKQHHEAGTKFFAVAGVGFILNGALMAVLTGPVRLHYLPAQLATTGIVLLWTFWGNRLWTFRDPGAALPRRRGGTINTGN